MGNPFSKQKTDPSHSDRKKIYRAQDSFIHKLVDTTHETNEKHDDGDTDSIGPAYIDDLDPNEFYPLMPETRDKEENQKKSLRNLRTVVSQHYDEIDAKVMKVHLDKYIFTFENLVFEGGGNKGLAYCGAVRYSTLDTILNIVSLTIRLARDVFRADGNVQVVEKLLEELGIMQSVKRFAGSSAGAMTASLLAVGYNSHEIEEFLSQDLSKIFLDHSCWYFSLLPNLVRGYGWNPGKRIFNWFGQTLAEITGNADITFNEVYEKYGNELCIVVTNLNMMNAEYFHPKTTPDVPVRVAVRMSMAIPGLFQASQYEQHGQTNTYVDGGVLCNYPINCYDGWWLSMKMEDSFLNRLQPLEDFPKLFEKKERFGEYNTKTLGFLLYADNERDILRDILQERVGVELPEFPKTKLAAEKIKKKKMQEKVKLEHIRILHAVSAFLKVLQKHNKDRDDKISKTELKNALNDTEDFPPRYVERLFGKNVTVDEAMAALDENQDGEVYYHELVHFIERTGVSLQTRFLGYQRKEINGVFSFFDTLQSALLTNVKRICVEERDIDRTVGINTGHVGTSDFKLEEKDREFVVLQGRRSTEAYLRYYVVQNNPQVKEGHKPDFDLTQNGASTSGSGLTKENNNTNEELVQHVQNESEAKHGSGNSVLQTDAVINRVQTTTRDQNGDIPGENVTITDIELHHDEGEALLKNDESDI